MVRGVIFNYLGVEGDDNLNFSFSYFSMLLPEHVVADSNMLAFSASEFILCPFQYCQLQMFKLLLHNREWNGYTKLDTSV